MDSPNVVVLRRFYEALARFDLDVDFAEERLSSVDAEERLRAAGHDSRSARRHLDAVAAQLILQSHFAANAPAALPPTDCSRTPR